MMGGLFLIIKAWFPLGETYQEGGIIARIISQPAGWHISWHQASLSAQQSQPYQAKAG
jgi:hypothetical protein